MHPIRSTLFVIGFFLCCFPVFVKAQNPYELKWKNELPVLGLGLAGQVTYFILEPKVGGLSAEQIMQLDKEDINKFERQATGFYSADARLVSDVLLYSSIAVPCLFFGNERTRKGGLELSVMAAEVALVNSSTTTLVKLAAKRVRPFVYNPDVDIDIKMERGARSSFYSGHTSIVSSLSFFSAKVFSDYYPESNWKPVVWSAAALLPAITGYCRVRAGKHFPTDVITGYVAGGLVGYLVPHFHKKKNKDSKGSIRFWGLEKVMGATLGLRVE